ncbi:TPA: hypothetical protein P5S08_003730 [Salmonella enterica subsp. enterica serovar Concord]|nr:hypothetical protein [Salmonella enterica subsp. enterica serovar Concord]
MNLEIFQVRELIQYASSNGFPVTVYSHYAVVKGFPGEEVQICFGDNGEDVSRVEIVRIYGSQSQVISPGHFKRLFIDRQWDNYETD